MNKEIVNKVAKSGLVTIDFLDYTPNEPILEFDIKNILFEGVVLKEKDFRSSLKEITLSNYENKIIALFCSTDTIIPMWAYMLIVSYLNPVSSCVYFGTQKEVLQKKILENINKIDARAFEGKKVIVKGCAKIPISESLYVAITAKLQNSVSSLMFGEACSAVPIYKKKK